jgi:RNA polymerase sigma-70 factor, ECF subfamily
MDEHRQRDTGSADELLPRVAAGDAGAFTDLFRRHRALVFRFALHMTGSRAAADDVTQDVFLAVMRDAGRYEPGRSSEAAWLCGIARNHVRRRRSEDRFLVPLPASGSVDEEAPREPGHGDALHGLMRDERVEVVRRAVASLPLRYREAIVLCDLQEMSYADTAAALGCAVGTVRSRLSRGRALLASKLGGGRATEPAAVEEDDRAALGPEKVDARSRA